MPRRPPPITESHLHHCKPKGQHSFLAEPPANMCFASLLGALRHSVSYPHQGTASCKAGHQTGTLLSSGTIAYLPTTSCSFHFFYQSPFHLSLTVLRRYRSLGLYLVLEEIHLPRFTSHCTIKQCYSPFPVLSFGTCSDKNGILTLSDVRIKRLCFQTFNFF